MRRNTSHGLGWCSQKWRERWKERKISRLSMSSFKRNPEDMESEYEPNQTAGIIAVGRPGMDIKKEQES